jgi:hypothetical protein
MFKNQFGKVIGKRGSKIFLNPSVNKFFLARNKKIQAN